MKLVFKEFRKGMEDFTKIIVNVVNFILLSIAYVLGVGLTAVIAKLSKKTFIDTKKHQKESYWIEEEIKTEAKEKYYRQF